MWMSDRWSDLRISLRGVARQPGFAAAVVLTFALGIGANAALFGIVDRLILQPPAHIADADDVAQLLVERDFLGRTIQSESMAWDDFLDAGTVGGLAGVGGYSSFGLTLGEGMGARRINAVFATHDFFPTLGVRPYLGRFYGPDDDAFGAPLVAVLGYDLWASQYGRDTGILGTTVRVAGVPYTVVGVAPRGFTGMELERVDAWLPLRPGKVATDGSDVWFSGRGYHWVRLAVRFAEGVGRQATLDQATSLHRAGYQKWIDQGRYDPEARMVARPLAGAVGPDAPAGNRVALWLAGVSALVLLIACANVANLLLARSLRRSRESAVRLALGISPWRLVEQHVLDTLVLALLGGATGLGLAFWGGAALRTRLLPDVDWTGASDGRVVGFTLAVSALAGLISAAAPGVMALRQRLSGALSQGARGSGSGHRVRALLTLGQASLATLLLVGAGLFIQSMRSARGADLGFDVGHLVAVDVEPAADLEGAELKDFYQRAADRLATLPHVEAVGATGSPWGWGFSERLVAEGLDSIPRTPAGGPYYHRVTDGYFHAMGIRIVQGRGLLPSDFGGAPVAVVNRTMADLLWPGQDPLGKCIYQGAEDGAPCTEVVGVSAYTHRGGVVEEEAPQYYITLTAADSDDPRSLMVRVSGDPQAATGPIVQGLHAGLTGVRMVRARPMWEVLDSDFRNWRMGMTVFSLFGVLALLVATVGLYSLLAFDVTERRREFGIRLALGASATGLRGSVLRRALALAGVGVMLGLAAAFVLAPRTGELLFQTSPHDPVVFLAAGGVLLVAAAMAGLVPARKATQVAPSEALKLE